MKFSLKELLRANILNSLQAYNEGAKIDIIIKPIDVSV